MSGSEFVSVPVGTPDAAEGEESMRSRNRRYEADLRDHLAEELRDSGLGAKTEHRMVFGRADIYVWDRRGAKAIIEVKVAEPLKGIGQLFVYAIGYRHEWPELELVLAIPEELDDGILRHACSEAGIRLWKVPKEDWSTPHAKGSEATRRRP